MSDTLHEDQYKFLIVSLPVLLRMRNVFDKCIEKSKHIFFSKILPFMR